MTVRFKIIGCVTVVLIRQRLASGGVHDEADRTVKQRRKILRGLLDHVDETCRHEEAQARIRAKVTRGRRANVFVSLFQDGPLFRSQMAFALSEESAKRFGMVEFVLEILVARRRITAFGNLDLSS